MRTIHKFDVSVFNETIGIELPVGSTVLHGGTQGVAIRVWVELDPDEKTTEIFEMILVGTGRPIPPRATHVNSIIEGHRGGFVWHLYRIEKSAPIPF